jgi:hypothetical protein
VDFGVLGRDGGVCRFSDGVFFFFSFLLLASGALNLYKVHTLDYLFTFSEPWLVAIQPNETRVISQNYWEAHLLLICLGGLSVYLPFHRHIYFNYMRLEKYRIQALEVHQIE